MNPDLERLQSYPFQKLTALLESARPDPRHNPIALYIGEPKHPTPEFIKKALADHLDGLANYPPTLGGEALRAAIAEWLQRRYGLEAVDPRSEVIPVNGSREALFAFAQAVVDATRPDPVVVCPNPFYQIYEGAALLARATPHYLNNVPENGYAFDFGQLPEALWRRTQLIYVCSGFVAGDAGIMKQFLLYRTYHGCAMPDAAFYLWPRTPLPDPEFARRLYQEQAVSVLPGSYLARAARGVNPGTNRVRIALVASVAECVEAATRIRAFVKSL